MLSRSGDMAPSSPIPSTSYGTGEELSPADISALNIDSDDDDIYSDHSSPIRRGSDFSQIEDANMNYHPLKNAASMDATCSSHLDDDYFDQLQLYADLESTLALEQDLDNASTSYDVNSLQFDDTSLTASEDLSVYCGTLKKPKRNKYKEKLLRDQDMWQATNVEVMENLLSRSGTVDEQIKWEAIATARGLCTLTDSCACGDCTRAKYLAGVTDGDGGLGAAPLFSAISVGCSVQ
ncbi:uncharacterized protein LOC135084741 [Ostrinia nubilalis]|uniref:uncharacterized protein LOC135084741 n=1 Tax=Ostrinia nubilalis TaxID=29057 RepID=UPI00308255BF